MKKLLFLCLTALTMQAPCFASNFNATVNGISYTFNSTDYTAKVIWYNTEGLNNTQYRGDITIPSTVLCGSQFYTVTSIGKEAFKWCTTLYSVTIPETVTSIGQDAFYGCSGLKSITFPNSVTGIGSEAFYGCSRLSSLTIPEKVTSIRDRTFYNCTSLSSVAIPESVTSIGQNAFYGCDSLASISIPCAVESIEYDAFESCANLTSIEVAESNQYYCSVDGVLYTKDKKVLAAFPGGKGPSFDIPDYVDSIGKGAFRSCSGLSSVTIPSSVTSIGDSTFYNCANLTSASISNSVTSIGESAFRECGSLASMTIPNSVTNIGSYAFYDCSSLVSVTIPNSVTSIGKYAFYRCSSLVSVTIPNSVTSIELRTFGYCSSLSSVVLGSSVRSIGGSAFYSCSNLTEIISLNPEPPDCTSSSLSGFKASNCTLIVPEGSWDAYALPNVAYASNNMWKTFGNIVEMDLTPVENVMSDSRMDAVGIYTLDGKRVSTPQKGVNIIRYSDGTVKKTFLK
ncbi:MAG: leucine-rich repeat domain-containing protein [Prevotellaceae bacterium]|nr:leucine-rich repeat domain-containing protein [Prevotellaceae bacterium]